MMTRHDPATRIRMFLRHYRWLSLSLLAIIILATADIGFIHPWREGATHARMNLEQETRRLRGDIGKVESSLKLLDEQGRAFEDLVARGWLARQDRLAAAKTIERLGDEYRMAELTYQFQPEKRLVMDDPQLRDVTMIETGISLGFEATLDLDFSLLAARLQDELPGSVDILGVSMSRVQPLALGDLLALEAGSNVPLIKGTAMLAWRTLEIDGVPPVARPQPLPPGAASPDTGGRNS